MTDLRDELLTDPLVRGYVGMTDQQATDDLNTVYRTRNRTEMTGDEVFQSIESQAVWDALTADQRLEFLSLCDRDILDPFGDANVNSVKSIFGDGSVTVTNLAAARVESITRAQELPGVVSPVKVGHVEVARIV